MQQITSAPQVIRAGYRQLLRIVTVKKRREIQVKKRINIAQKSYEVSYYKYYYIHTYKK